MSTVQNIFNQAKQKMTDSGYTVSEGGSWIDEERGQVYVSSVESYGPATYGHPKAEISYSAETGWYSGTFEKRQHNFAVKLGA
jgi:hypothetical protein